MFFQKKSVDAAQFGYDFASYIDDRLSIIDTDLEPIAKLDESTLEVAEIILKAAFRNSENITGKRQHTVVILHKMALIWITALSELIRTCGYHSCPDKICQGMYGYLVQVCQIKTDQQTVELGSSVLAVIHKNPAVKSGQFRDPENGLLPLREWKGVSPAIAHLTMETALWNKNLNAQQYTLVMARLMSEFEDIYSWSKKASRKIKLV